MVKLLSVKQTEVWWMFSLESGQEVSVTCYTDASILLMDLEQHVWSSYNSCTAPLLGISSECSPLTRLLYASGCTLPTLPLDRMTIDDTHHDRCRSWRPACIVYLVTVHSTVAVTRTRPFAFWPVEFLTSVNLAELLKKTIVLMKRDTIIKNRRGLNSWNEWMYPS